MLPRHFRVGRMRFTVVNRQTIAGHNKGTALIPTARKGEGKVLLARRPYANGKPYSDADRVTSFWHEMVHIILYDMKRQDWNDEEFVEAFARRLSRAINSARGSWTQNQSSGHSVRSRTLRIARADTTKFVSSGPSLAMKPTPRATGKRFTRRLKSQ